MGHILSNYEKYEHELSNAALLIDILTKEIEYQAEGNVIDLKRLNAIRAMRQNYSDSLLKRAKESEEVNAKLNTVRNVLRYCVERER